MTTPETLSYNPAHGERGLGDLSNPTGSPAVLAIHGGGWAAQDKASWRGVAEYLADHGCCVYNINYRLCGMEPWPACGDDCLDAAHFLLEKHDRIFLVGGSAGGHLALMTGLRLPHCRVAGIVAISAIGDLRADLAVNPDRYRYLFGGEPTKQQIEEATPMSYLGNPPPILYTHSLYDTVVPIESAKNFVAASGAESYFYDEGRRDEGHAIWIPGSEPHKLYPDIEERILDFIRRHH